MNLPWPEAAIIDEETLDEQIAATARELPSRPLVLGGCCCAHVGAVLELARRHGRIGVLWIDAHGDLNTPASSPSGNAWGMPLRMLIDAGAVAAGDVALVGARSLDPPEVEFIREAGIRTEPGGLPDRVYVALDCDVLDPGLARRVHARAGRPDACEPRVAPRHGPAAGRCRPDRPRRLGAKRRAPAQARACARAVTARRL